MKPALIYARARTPVQITGQIQQLRTYAEKNGYAVVCTLADGGPGGTGFMDLLTRAVQLGEEVTVLVTDPCRLTRHLGMLDLMMFVLDSCRVQVRFVGFPEVA